MAPLLRALLWGCWLWLVACLLSACVAPFRDPDIDLRTLTQPDPLPPVLPAAAGPPVSPPGRPPSPAVWRAWVPRHVTPNGDVTAGHWLDISPHEPAVEQLEPEKPLPRAPRMVVPKPASPPPAALPQAPPPPPPPGGSPGLWPPGAHVAPRFVPPGLHGGE